MEYLRKEMEKKMENAKKEYEGKKWIHENLEFDLENVIYYENSGIFCFGWDNPLSKENGEKLFSLLEGDFPYKFEIEIETDDKNVKLINYNFKDVIF